MNRKEYRLLLEGWRHFLIESGTTTLLEDFEKWSEYDVFSDVGDMGNCSFYAWEFGRFCQKKAKQTKIVYMWHDINLHWVKDGDAEGDDHIVVCVDGVIFDFVKGLSSEGQSNLTQEQRENPDAMPFSESLFEDEGYYGSKDYHCYYVEDSPEFDALGNNDYSVKCTSFTQGKAKNRLPGVRLPWEPQVSIHKPKKSDLSRS